MKLNTYLNFAGNCAEALAFYQEKLGGKILVSMSYDQMPEPRDIKPGTEKHVMHARIQIADAVLMASDGPIDPANPMGSCSLTLSVESSAEAERLFALLAEGGQIKMAMAETFFAHRFGMLRDRFGINWMVIHQNSPE